MRSHSARGVDTRSRKSDLSFSSTARGAHVRPVQVSWNDVRTLPLVPGPYAPSRTGRDTVGSFVHRSITRTVVLHQRIRSNSNCLGL